MAVQYRILHRILTVDFYLKKINVKTNNQCYLCKNGVETILHVFCKCEKALHIYRTSTTQERFEKNV